MTLHLSIMFSTPLPYLPHFSFLPACVEHINVAVPRVDVCLPSCNEEHFEVLLQTLHTRESSQQSSCVQRIHAFGSHSCSPALSHQTEVKSRIWGMNWWLSVTYACTHTPTRAHRPIYYCAVAQWIAVIIYTQMLKHVIRRSRQRVTVAAASTQAS